MRAMLRSAAAAHTSASLEIHPACCLPARREQCSTRMLAFLFFFFSIGAAEVEDAKNWVPSGVLAGLKMCLSL